MYVVSLWKFGIKLLLNSTEQPNLVIFGLLNFGLCCHGNWCVFIHLHGEVFNRL